MQLTRHEVSTIRTALHTERRAGEIAESRMAELEDWLASLQMPTAMGPTPKPDHHVRQYAPFHGGTPRAT